DFGGKTSIFSHPVYLFLRKFSLQDSRGGSAMTERRLDTELQQFGNVRTQKLCKQVKGYV
ncbi:hypothetical protein EYV18_23675, partial [Escherichia coli]